MPWINSTFEKPVWIWLHFNPQMCWKRRTVHGIGQFCSTKYWWSYSKGYFFMLPPKKSYLQWQFFYCYNDKYALCEEIFVKFSLILKVSQFQIEFMKSSFLPKYEQKIVRISALCSEGRNLDIFFVGEMMSS